MLDGVSVADLKRLPQNAYSEAAFLWDFAEEVSLPSQILTPSVLMVPKLGGGYRPITITLVLYMVLLEALDQHLVELCSFWDTACKGSSALTAAL